MDHMDLQTDTTLALGTLTMQSMIPQISSPCPLLRWKSRVVHINFHFSAATDIIVSSVSSQYCRLMRHISLLATPPRQAEGWALYILAVPTPQVGLINLPTYTNSSLNFLTRVLFLFFPTQGCYLE